MQYSKKITYYQYCKPINNNIYNASLFSYFSQGIQSITCIVLVVFFYSLSLLLYPAIAYTIPLPLGIIPEHISAYPIAPAGRNIPATVCYRNGVLTSPLIKSDSAAQRILHYHDAWFLGKGHGQKVAIIDTGISRHQRLPHYIAGGDYVADPTAMNPDQWNPSPAPRLDGSWDCDGHGTAIAGIVAAAPDEADNFVGVAPQATIISIRQFSLTWKLPDKVTEPTTWIGPYPHNSYGPLLTLAKSIMRAIHLGAQIILIPTPACIPSHNHSQRVADNLNALGNAVRYAYLHNIVIVAGSGMTTTESRFSPSYTVQTCINNPLPPSDMPIAKKTYWNTVRSIIAPSIFSKYVITVAATDNSGHVYPTAVHGSWVDVAAPGQHIISLNSDGYSLTDTRQSGKKSFTLEGSDYAAAYVAGVVALLREHFPADSPSAIKRRLQITAHHPGYGGTIRNDAIGFGIIDPIAALTTVIPKDKQFDSYDDNSGQKNIFSAPSSSPTPVIITLVGIGIIAIMSITIFLIFFIRRTYQKPLHIYNQETYETKVSCIEPHGDPGQWGT